MKPRNDWSIVNFSMDAADQVLDVWNRTLGQEYPLSADLLAQNSYGNNGHSKTNIFLCKEKDTIIGFSITKFEENLNGWSWISGSKGWISALIVDKDHQKKGVGSSLLSHAEQHLTKLGARTLFLGGDNNHFFPGVPVKLYDALRHFSQKGYTYLPSVYDLVITEEKLFKFAGYISKSKSGETIKEAAAEDMDALLNLMERNFPHRWSENMNRYFNSGGNCQNVILLKVGQEIAGFCHIHPKLEKLISPTLYWKDLLYEGKVAGLGPMGIARKYRGYGLGRQLLWTSLARLAQEPIRAVVLDWAPQHLVTSLYKQSGFEIWKAYSPGLKINLLLGKPLAVWASNLAYGVQVYRGINLKRLKNRILP